MSRQKKFPVGGGLYTGPHGGCGLCGLRSVPSPNAFHSSTGSFHSVTPFSSQRQNHTENKPLPTTTWPITHPIETITASTRDNSHLEFLARAFITLNSAVKSWGALQIVMAAPTGVLADDDVDALLERYLSLLDEYTTLRSALAALQTSVYQDIARANFSAERGIRYGQDMYDERMQRTRYLSISTAQDGTPVFSVVSQRWEDEASRVAEHGNAGANEVQSKSGDEKAVEKEQPKAQRSTDPLRWFGILTPLPLRQAQSKSIEAVEEIIPQLVMVNAQMVDAEIRVRRARKRRAKAEAAAVKQKQQQHPGPSQSEGVSLQDTDSKLESDVEQLALDDRKNSPRSGNDIAELSKDSAISSK